MDLNIRRASFEDIEFLFALHRETMREYVDQIWGWREDEQREMFKRGFRPGEIRIIQSEGEDIGVVWTEKSADAVELKRIEIRPECQRRGIGSAVLKRVTSEARGNGLSLRLRVLKINPAHQLYERLGFQRTGESEHHYNYELAERPAEQEAQ